MHELDSCLILNNYDFVHTQKATGCHLLARHSFDKEDIIKKEKKRKTVQPETRKTDLITNPIFRFGSDLRQ